MSARSEGILLSAAAMLALTRQTTPVRNPTHDDFRSVPR